MKLKLIKYLTIINLITCFSNSGISQNVYHWFPSGSGTTNSLTGTGGRFCSGYGGIILYTSNSGLNWVIQNSGTSTNLYSINNYNDNVIASGQAGLILLLTNLGINWTQINYGSNNFIYGVTRRGLNVYIAAGSGGTIVRSTNNGLNWVQTGTENLLPAEYISTGLKQRVFLNLIKWFY